MPKLIAGIVNRSKPYDKAVKSDGNTGGLDRTYGLWYKTWQQDHEKLDSRLTFPTDEVKEKQSYTRQAESLGAMSRSFTLEKSRVKKIQNFMFKTPITREELMSFISFILRIPLAMFIFADSKIVVNSDVKVDFEAVVECFLRLPQYVSNIDVNGENFNITTAMIAKNKMASDIWHRSLGIITNSVINGLIAAYKLVKVELENRGVLSDLTTVSLNDLTGVSFNQLFHIKADFDDIPSCRVLFQGLDSRRMLISPVSKTVSLIKFASEEAPVDYITTMRKLQQYKVLLQLKVVSPGWTIKIEDSPFGQEFYNQWSDKLDSDDINVSRFRCCVITVWLSS